MIELRRTGFEYPLFEDIASLESTLRQCEGEHISLIKKRESGIKIVRYVSVLNGEIVHTYSNQPALLHSLFD